MKKEINDTLNRSVKLGENLYTVAVLVNWKVKSEFDFSKHLRGMSGWQVKTIGGTFPSNLNKVSKVLLAWPQYVSVPLRLILSRAVYDKVICWQQVYGIVLGFMIRFTKIPIKSDIYIMTFIVVPKKQRGFFYNLIRYSIGCNNVKKIICYNSSELELYRGLFIESAGKFLAAKYSEDIPDIDRYKVKNSGYFLSVGRSNRDYKFLIEYFTRHPEKTVHLVSDNLKKVCERPNIHVHNNTYNEEYFQLIAECQAIILAFDDVTVSSGQMVFTHALQFGKPVIVTESCCLKGYIVNMYNGIEIRKSIGDLDDAINKLADKNLYLKISENQKNDYKARFGIGRLAKEIFEIVQ